MMRHAYIVRYTRPALHDCDVWETGRKHPSQHPAAAMPFGCQRSAERAATRRLKYGGAPVGPRQQFGHPTRWGYRGWTADTLPVPLILH